MNDVVGYDQKDFGRDDSSPTQRVVVEAPAKVNLSLLIVRRRADGYHDLDTVFQAVSLFDTVELTRNDAPTKEPAGRGAVGPAARGDSRDASARFVAEDGVWLEMISPWATPCDETNLALRAARLFARETGFDLSGWGIRIRKRIPLGGGLAGGSADAAGVLVGLNALLARPVALATLMEWGLALGSDVPFCVLGGTARGMGRGEILHSVAGRLPFWMTLVNPGVTVETSKAFAAFDPGLQGRDGDLSSVVRALESGRPDVFVRSLNNTFELCVAGLYPELSEVKRRMLAAGCEATLLSGSGATVWGFSRSEDRAESAANLLRSFYPFVQTVNPISRGAAVVELA